MPSEAAVLVPVFRSEGRVSSFEFPVSRFAIRVSTFAFPILRFPLDLRGLYGIESML